MFAPNGSRRDPREQDAMRISCLIAIFVVYHAFENDCLTSSGPWTSYETQTAKNLLHQDSLEAWLFSYDQWRRARCCRHWGQGAPQKKADRVVRGKCRTCTREAEENLAFCRLTLAFCRLITITSWVTTVSVPINIIIIINVFCCPARI